MEWQRLRAVTGDAHVSVDVRALNAEVAKYHGELVTRALIDTVHIRDRDLRGGRASHRDRHRERSDRSSRDGAPVGRGDRALDGRTDMGERGSRLRVVWDRDRHRYRRRNMRIELDRVVAEREPGCGRRTQVPGCIGRGELDGERPEPATCDNESATASAGTDAAGVVFSGALGAAATGRAATTNTAATPTRSAIDRFMSGVPGGGARSTDHRDLIGQTAR